MKISTKTLIISSILLLSACGPSKEELARLQLLEEERARIAAEQARKEAETRKQRLDQRLLSAEQHWKNQQYMTEDNVRSLFDRSSANTSSDTYFVSYPLQAAKYQYKKGFHPLNIVGIRTLPNSGPYSNLFPDESAAYAPGHSAKSVVEFSLLQDEQENRLGQKVLAENGNRWVASVLNFKNYPALKNLSNNWSWIPGIFEDLRWQDQPEATHAYTEQRSLEIQMGFRFCTLSRCYSDIDYQGHPTHAVRADVMSIIVGDRKSGKILARFVRDDA